jgi:hypothetical protein
MPYINISTVYLLLSVTIGILLDGTTFCTADTAEEWYLKGNISIAQGN